jgi:arylsulfatase A-like enzyme
MRPPPAPTFRGAQRMRTCVPWLLIPVVSLVAAGFASAADDRPNLLVILADDLGYADLGCQGCTDIPTPHIDSIAAGGVRFTDGYATHPVCSPSRAGLMSGRYQHRFGFEHNSGPELYAAPNFGLPRSIPTLAERLKAAGYATGMVGKWHIGFQQGLRPHERGFDDHFGFLGGAHTYFPDRGERVSLVRNGEPVEEREYLTDAFARESVAFIERNKARPFFLYLAFNAVHSPLQATQAYEDRFPQIADPKRRTYAGMTAAMDDAVGRVLETLREHRLEENTLVFFYSDNGGPTRQTTSRNDPLRGYKGQVFEGGIRVPLLIQWKGKLPAGQVYRKPVMAFDITATALAAAGIATPKEKPLDGVDLLPFLLGQKREAPHASLFWRAGPQHAARVGDWKLVHDPRQGERDMLFLLAEDIGEQKDLAAERPEKLKELRAAYAAWAGQMMPAQWVRQDRRNAEPRGKLKDQPLPRRRGGSRGARLEQAFRRADRNADGKLSAEEFPRPEVFQNVDRDGDGLATPEEIRQYYRDRRPGRPRPLPTVELGEPEPQIDQTQPRVPGEPPLRKPRPGDAGEDAKGRGQLFESIVVPGFTDIVEGTNGIALADLNRDGLVDLVATYSPPRGTGERWGRGERLRVFVNEGGFQFRPHRITLHDSQVSLDRFGRGQVPNLVDFNGDGWLDLFVTRHAPTSGGINRRGIDSVGNSLFVTDGAWDVFRDVSHSLGIRNEEAYNRQSCFGDVNRDGWLDIAIGCDNIKNAFGGFPHSRLYVFRPQDSRHSAHAVTANGSRRDPASLPEGRFEDIGRTELVPDFGGFYHDSDRDKAGPDINLVDLDNDGDLDLLQTCHVDVREPLLPYWPGEYRQGVFCWKSLLAETGELRFEKITDNGLACEARLKYDRQEQVFRPLGKAPGLPYVSFSDVDNDGLPDVLAVGPASPGWAPRTEYVGGRFWRNLGKFQFAEATAQAGLDPLNWPMHRWLEFYEEPIPDTWRRWPSWGRRGRYESQPGLPRQDPGQAIPYFADAVFVDFDNDGWIDVVVVDRSESTRRQARAALFTNRGDGSFELRPTTFSGLDSPGISAEAADLDNDGLVDLVLCADPDNSGVAITPDRYQDKVYWNTGEHGARDNHWLRLRFRGVSDAELIGARVEVLECGDSSPDSTKLLGTRWIHSNHTYKSGGALEAHFGLGKHDRVDVRITLLDGMQVAFADVEADQLAEAYLHKRELLTITTP